MDDLMLARMLQECLQLPWPDVRTTNGTSQRYNPTQADIWSRHFGAICGLSEQENAWQFTHTQIPRQRSIHEAELDRAFVRSDSAVNGPASDARAEVDDDEALARQLMMEEERAFQLRLQQMAGVVHADEADSLEEGDHESLADQDEGELDPVRPPSTRHAAHTWASYRT